MPTNAYKMPIRCLKDAYDMPTYSYSIPTRYLQMPKDAYRCLQMPTDAYEMPTRCLQIYDTYRCLEYAYRCLQDAYKIPKRSLKHAYQMPTDAYRCLQDAYNCLQMPTDAYRCLPDAYQMPDTLYDVKSAWFSYLCISLCDVNDSSPCNAMIYEKIWRHL